MDSVRVSDAQLRGRWKSRNWIDLKAKIKVRPNGRLCVTWKSQIRLTESGSGWDYLDRHLGCNDCFGSLYILSKAGSRRQKVRLFYVTISIDGSYLQVSSVERES
jgi:hypothetical protein